MRIARYLLRCVVVAVVLVVGTVDARAQDWFGLATYQISKGVGDTEEFIDDVSFLGAGLDLRKTLFGGTTAGVGMAWNVFHDRTEGVIELDNGAVSGSQDRYINAFPIMFGLHQYIGNWRKSRVHFGINAGGFLLIQTFRIGVTEFEEDTWEWGVAPEAGVVVPIRTGAWFAINARYQWSPTTQTLLGNEIELTYYQINIGFMWEQ